MDEPPGSGGVVQESSPQHEHVKVKSHLYSDEPNLTMYFDFCSRLKPLTL